jgi:hypothetical protein
MQFGRGSLRVVVGIAVMAAVLGLTGAAAAADPTGYSFNDGGTGNDGFYTIDLATGVATQISALQLPTVRALSFSTDGRLFGIDGVSAELVTVDLTTGARTTVGSLNLPSGHDILNGGLTFGLDGRLWLSAVTLDPPSTILNEWYEVDPATGQASQAPLASSVLLQGVTGASQRVFALAGRCDGAIFGIGASGQLYAIDPDTATATPIGSESSLDQVGGADFAADGSLWGISFGSNATTSPGQTFADDPASGVPSNLHSVTIGGNPALGFESLAIAPVVSCPTPPPAAAPLTARFTG